MLAAGRRTRLGLVLGLPLAAAALYTALGDPGAIGPRRAELSQGLREGAADPAFTEALHAELGGYLSRRADDARARVLLARLDLQAQRYDAAAAGYALALNGPSKVARDPAVWLERAEALALAQGGLLAGEPRALVGRALQIDPDNPKALDLAGSAAFEAGEFELAVQHWRRLLGQLGEGEPRHAELSRAIAAAGQRASLARPGPLPTDPAQSPAPKAAP